MGDPNRQQHQGHDRYSNRQYQPYVFRPNFMKNTDGQTKQYGRKVIDWTGSCAQTIISRRFKRNLKDRTHYQEHWIKILFFLW